MPWAPRMARTLQAFPPFFFLSEALLGFKRLKGFKGFPEGLRGARASRGLKLGFRVSGV